MQNRKQHVLLTAQRLFSEKGFLATSIQDILNESNISKGTFYNYFSSKSECLIAILEHGRDEVANRRRELLIGKDHACKDTLIRQISIRLDVNREFNLIPIFQTIFLSEDATLKKFVTMHQIKETAWLRNRLIDVYGPESKHVAMDFSIIMYGIMHQMMQSWKLAKIKRNISTIELVSYAMRRVDSIVDNMIETNDTFIGDQLSFASDINIVGKTLTKKQLITKLTTFNKSLTADQKREKQFCKFLIEEVSADVPQIYLLETVIKSFREAFIKTDYEIEARDIATHVWNYLRILESK